MKQKAETVLFAVIGMSPAVLTETVWALARETPRVVPDRVVVLTTTRGAEAVRRELFGKEPCIWDELRTALRAKTALRFGTTASDILVFSRADPNGRSIELQDIRAPEDNMAVADFILDHLRRFTERPDTRIIASIAGGRKTMGAILYACMSLIGRETDRITHVLVDEELENPKRRPRFFFPRSRDEEPAVHLADIPFVPLRNRFDELPAIPGSFRSLVAHYSRRLRNDETETLIRFEPGRVVVDETPVALQRRAMLALQFLVSINGPGREVPRLSDVEASLGEFLASRDPAWSNSLAHPEDLKRALSSIRKAMERAGLHWRPGLRAEALKLPRFRVVD